MVDIRLSNVKREKISAHHRAVLNRSVDSMKAEAVENLIRFAEAQRCSDGPENQEGSIVEHHH